MLLLPVLEGSAFCAGIALGTASVLSVGPNTVTLIREGLAGERVSLVATLDCGSRLVLLDTALALTDTIATKGAALRPVLSWLGFGGHACTPLFRRPGALRMLDLSSGVLSVLATVLAVGLCLRPPG